LVQRIYHNRHVEATVSQFDSPWRFEITPEWINISESFSMDETPNFFNEISIYFTGKDATRRTSLASENRHKGSDPRAKVTDQITITHMEMTRH
jgi:hypothetical protein